MIKTFRQYASSRDYYGENLGYSDSRSSSDRTGMDQTDAQAAFKDLSGVLASAMAGSSGGKIISSIVNSLMGDSQIPENLKLDIRRRVNERWSHVVDMSNSPAGQGPGLANLSGDTSPQKKVDRSMSNVVVMNPSDNLGVGG